VLSVPVHESASVYRHHAPPPRTDGSSYTTPAPPRTNAQGPHDRSQDPDDPHGPPRPNRAAGWTGSPPPATGLAPRGGTTHRSTTCTTDHRGPHASHDRAPPGAPPAAPTAPPPAPRSIRRTGTDRASHRRGTPLRTPPTGPPHGHRYTPA